MPCHAVCTRTEACGCGVRTPAHDPVWSCREVSPVLTAMCYDSFERPTRQFSDESLHVGPSPWPRRRRHDATL